LDLPYRGSPGHRRHRRKLGYFDPDPNVDADLMQHTGMVRIENHALDRSMMMPSQLTPAKLARSIVELAS
jgi:protein SCO1/2